jgi:hypothetical protein
LYVWVVVVVMVVVVVVMVVVVVVVVVVLREDYPIANFFILWPIKSFFPNLFPKP